MRTTLLLPSLVSAALFAGCSGGGGSSTPGTTTTGSVLVVVDTATGSDQLASVQIEGAVLERADGTTTGNLLANPHLVRLADPTGTPDGLVLRDAPTGDYRALRLFLVPQSGSVVPPNGSALPLLASVGLTVPIDDVLRHTNAADSWLVIGHDGAPPPATGGANWTPQMSARTGGAPVAFEDLAVAFVAAPELTAQAAALGSAPLRMTFAAGCEFADDSGSLGDAGRFLDGIGDDRLHMRGELRRDGRVLCTHAHRSGRNDNPRLIGRITGLEPLTQSLVVDLQAQNPRGGPLLDPLPATIRVVATNARLRNPNDQPIAFASLQLQNLVKVKWTSRSEPAGELPRFVASEIEVAGGPAAMQIEWEGEVAAVDVAQQTITVVPRNDDPIVVGGVSVPQVTLQLDANTLLQRKAAGGGDRWTIGLGEVVPGGDRIWWRGSVTGADTFDVHWVRVRTD